MFDQRRRSNLAHRLLNRERLPLNSQNALCRIAPIAMANHPKGAEIPVLTPVIPRHEVHQLTHRYLDGWGTLDELYLAIWDLTEAQYAEAILARA